jgi:ferritin-like metal-binding protein YciE
MSSMESLDDLMQYELRDIYDAEKQLTRALPKLAKKATNNRLRAALLHHLKETQGHVERLEQIFERLGLPAKGRRSEGMKHLIEEGNDLIGDAEEDATRDAVMIAAAQRVEHYEIASYGTIRTWANVLGKTDVAALLEDTLEEEKEADQKLTSIAGGFVNEVAAGRVDEEQEEEERSVGRGRRIAPRAAGRAAVADRTRTGHRGHR